MRVLYGDKTESFAPDGKQRERRGRTGGRKSAEMKKVLAIDMGAISIRGILSWIEGERFHFKEVLRLKHRIVEKNGRKRWEWDRILSSIRDTIVQHQAEISSVGIDSWGVDFGLLDEGGELIEEPISYRDERHIEGYREALLRMDREELFRKSGAEPMPINTLFQLLTLRKIEPEQFKRARRILMLPDLLLYFLSGEISGERTIWSTSQLLDIESGEISAEIAERFSLPPSLFPELREAGTVLGSTKNSRIPELRTLDIPVISVMGHDTASAIFITEAARREDTLFLSCGTWSLMGARLEHSDRSREACRLGLTNELGYRDSKLLFQNITGLYLLEKYKSEREEDGAGKLSYERITEEAAESFRKRPGRGVLIDLSDPRFGAGERGAKESIDSWLLERGEALPEEEGAYFRLIYESLTEKYRSCREAVEKRSGRRYERLHMIGGGTCSPLLCELIAERLGLELLAGPVEASALGNVLLQLQALGEIESAEQGALRILAESGMRHYRPGEKRSFQL